MEEFGDWVYIILMVVVGISSLFNSINKKKGKQQTQMPSPAPSEPSYPAPPVPAKKKRELPPPVPGHIKHQPFNTHLTYPTIEDGLRTDIFLTQEEENTLANELELSDPDAFRKAVIYSTVINRKYAEVV